MAGKVGEEHWGAQTGYRARRLARFVALADEILKEKGEVRILDMGGNRDYWLDLEPVWKGRNFKFTLVNLQPERLDDARFEEIVEKETPRPTAAGTVDGRRNCRTDRPMPSATAMALAPPGSTTSLR